MFNSIVRLFTTVAPDFEVLWLAASDSITSSNPYLNTQIFTGVGYPPNTLLFYLPLTIFNYMTAQNIFTIVSIISLLLIIFLIFRILNISNKYYFFCLIASLFSFPAKFTIGMGQNNFIALALLILSYFLYKQKKLVFAGIIVGLSISLKTIFVYFLLFYLFKKEWKILVYSISTILFSILLIYFIRGNLDLFLYYYQNVLPPLFRFENREIYMNQGISGFVSRLFVDLSIRKLLTTVISLILILYNAFIIFKRKNIDLVFSLIIITLLLIDSLAWQHHFVWLIFPFITLIKYSDNLKDKLIVLISYFLISLNIPESVFLQDNVFWGTLILYGLNLKYLR